MLFQAFEILELSFVHSYLVRKELKELRKTGQPYLEIVARSKFMFVLSGKVRFHAYKMKELCTGDTRRNQQLRVACKNTKSAICEMLRATF